MIRKCRNGIEFLQFELLAEERALSHGVFLKSEEPGFLEGCQKIIHSLEIDHLVSGKQIHGAEIEKVEEPSFFAECDGILTNKSKIGLMVRHADCQAAIFYDPIAKAIANVHAGWRGNIANIYAKSIEKMRLHFHSKPENLLVCISPSLGPEHSEFIHYKQEFPQAFWRFQTRENYFDLWALAEFQLQEAGILPHHLQIAKICTYSEEKDFFSYRRDKVRGRNNATVISILENMKF